MAGIERLAALDPPRVGLAVSLNAPEDAIRSRIMPVNRRHGGMAALRSALASYPLGPKQALFMEYVLIGDVNDRPEHARRLARKRGR